MSLNGELNINHDSDVSQNPKLKKYWDLRYELFAKYDSGVKLDHESWFSVTPEKIAQEIAQEFKKFNKCSTVIDAFCGCGGNSIQFALAGFKVLSIDIDQTKINFARHNAEIYGVNDYIQFINGNFMELAKFLKADAIFLSPPWGGVDYINSKTFNLETMIPMNGMKLFELASKVSENIGYYIPKNVDMDQVNGLAKNGSNFEVKSYFGETSKELVVLTAYYGNFKN